MRTLKPTHSLTHSLPPPLLYDPCMWFVSIVALNVSKHRAADGCDGRLSAPPVARQRMHWKTAIIISQRCSQMPDATSHIVKHCWSRFTRCYNFDSTSIRPPFDCIRPRYTTTRRTYIMGSTVFRPVAMHEHYLLNTGPTLQSHPLPTTTTLITGLCR